MQRVVGAFLGLLLARIILPMVLGPVGMMYFSLSVVGVVLSFLALWGGSILKMRRFKRKLCDDALFYARKKRRAANEPDFREDELRDVGLARKRGDFQAVHSLIASANKRLSDDKWKSARLASAQAQAHRVGTWARSARDGGSHSDRFW